MNDTSKFIADISSEERQKINNIRPSALSEIQLNEVMLLLEVINNYLLNSKDTFLPEVKKNLHNLTLHSLILGLQFFRDHRLKEKNNYNMTLYLVYWVANSLEKGDVTPNKVFKIKKK